jgi:thioredoxin-like negative regulator of GroEL
MNTNKKPWLLTVTLAVALNIAAAQAEEIFWYKDLKQATAAAEERNLPLFVDFWADWCAACKIMDEEVYTDAKVIEAFRSKIIGVRVHFDLQQDLARRYEVPALPFLVFTNSYGMPLLYHRGFLEAEDLTKVVEAMPDVAEINRLDRILQEDRNDFNALLRMAETLRAAAFYETSSTYYDRALKRDEAKKDAARRETLLAAMGNNWLELEHGKNAAPIFERCVKEFPQSDRRPDYLLSLGRAYYLDEKNDKARQTLELLIKESANSPAAAQAQKLLAELAVEAR